jgi:serralysin
MTISVASIARVYEAGLNRHCDRDGLNFWIERHDHATSFADMAKDFLDSEALPSRSGDETAKSAATVVTRMSETVRDRAPAKAGYDFWTHTLDAGVSREQVLLGFSESFENHARSADPNGLHQESPGVWDI